MTGSEDNDSGSAEKRERSEDAEDTTKSEQTHVVANEIFKLIVRTKN